MRWQRQDPGAHRKQSLYFNDGVLAEMRHEAKRLDRSVSRVVQRAWTIARDEIRRLPSVVEPSE